MNTEPPRAPVQADSQNLSPQDSHYIMPVGVEGADATGHKMVMETKLLKCPMVLPGKGRMGWSLPKGALGSLLPALCSDTWQS